MCIHSTLNNCPSTINNLRNRSFIHQIYKKNHNCCILNIHFCNYFHMWRHSICASFATWNAYLGQHVYAHRYQTPWGQLFSVEWLKFHPQLLYVFFDRSHPWRKVAESISLIHNTHPSWHLQYVTKSIADVKKFPI
jgi:hypothetical protein